MPIPDFTQAFREGAKATGPDGKQATIAVHPTGDLVMTTGRIVACDPFVCPETEPFTVTAQPGQYPVLLSIAHLANGDKRVAYAMLRFEDRPTARWEMALLPDQNPNDLKDDEWFCYGVDSGTGCFMDAETAAELMRAEGDNSGLAQRLDDEMAKSYQYTWSWANVSLDAADGANVIVFSSGWGDGCYPSYFGYDAAGHVVCLVTDFHVLGDETTFE